MVGVRTMQSIIRLLFGFERYCSTDEISRILVTDPVLGSHSVFLIAIGWFNRISPKGGLKELIEKI